MQAEDSDVIAGQEPFEAAITFEVLGVSAVVRD